jgi:hypothetical protein
MRGQPLHAESTACAGGESILPSRPERVREKHLSLRSSVHSPLRRHRLNLFSFVFWYTKINYHVGLNFPSRRHRLNLGYTHVPWSEDPEPGTKLAGCRYSGMRQHYVPGAHGLVLRKYAALVLPPFHHLSHTSPTPGLPPSALASVSPPPFPPLSQSVSCHKYLPSFMVQGLGVGV